MTNNALSIPDFVKQQETFFNNVRNTEVVHWEKESQFAIQALSNNDYLAKAAYNSPASLQNALINVAAIGISLNPALKNAYLVPRSLGKGKPPIVCLDISYQGLLHLAMQAGSIEWGQAKLVYANDDYQNTGIDKAPIHVQKTFGDKGEIVGVYCTVKTKSGDYLTEEMDIKAIKKVQAASKAANGPWVTWWEEMARKTVVKRASKYWPKSESMGLAVMALDEHEGLIQEEKDITPHPNSKEAREAKQLAREQSDLYITISGYLADESQHDFAIEALEELESEEEKQQLWKLFTSEEKKIVRSLAIIGF